MKQLTFIMLLVLSFTAFSQPSKLLSEGAIKDFNNSNFEKCISEMTLLIKSQPNNDEVYVERGRCYYFSASSIGYNIIKAEKAKTISDEDKIIEAANIEFDSRRIRAIDDATKAISLNPKNAVAFNLRGLVKSKIEATDTQSTAQRSAIAILDFDQAIKIDPKFIKAYINRGMELYQNSNFEGALADFKTILAIDPKNETALGLLPLALKRVEDAKTLVNECLKSDRPLNCLYVVEKYAEAHPNSAKAFLDLARINNTVEKYTEVENREKYWKNAETAYLKGIQLNPTGIEAYVELFDIYKEKLRSKANAKVVAERAVEKIPNDPNAYVLRGRALESDQNWTAAITDFSRAIELNPKFSKAYEHRSNSYARLKQFDKALADLNKAIEIDPNNGSAYFMRGTFFAFQNKQNEAIADFSKADNFNITCAKTSRGAEYTKIAAANKESSNSENYNKAQQDFLADDAVKCYDTNNQYGIMLTAQGLFDKAAVQFDKALVSYKKFGFSTAQIEKFQVLLEAEKTSTKTVNTNNNEDPNIEKILAAMKDNFKANGGELIVAHTPFFKVTNLGDDYTHFVWGDDAYVFVAVSEYDEQLSVGIKAYTNGGGQPNKPPKTTYDKSRIDNYSVVIYTINIPKYTDTSDFNIEPIGSGYIHWLLFRKRYY